MFKRNKKPAVTIDDAAQAEGALAEMAMLERQIAQAKLTMQEEIDVIKARTVEAITPWDTRWKELHAAVKRWATMNKSVLFTTRKSLDLAFGVIGFKEGNKIQQMDGVSKDETLTKIRQFGFVDAIRVIEEIDKEAMERWPDERLALVGCIRRASDVYFCKIHQEKITHTNKGALQ